MFTTVQLSRDITTHSFKIERTQNKAGLSSTILSSKSLIPPRFLKKLLEVMIPTSITILLRCKQQTEVKLTKV